MHLLVSDESFSVIIDRQNNTTLIHFYYLMKIRS
jgi:hypothetical protein